MKIQSNAGLSMPAISLESDGTELNPGLLFSQFLPLMDAHQKMPENRQENAVALPLPISPGIMLEEIDLQVAQPVSSPPLTTSVIAQEVKSLTPDISALPDDAPAPGAPLKERVLTATPASEISTPLSFDKIAPQVTDETTRKTNEVVDLNKFIPRVTVDELVSELTPERDDATEFLLQANKTPSPLIDAQKIVAQLQLIPKEKNQAPQSEIKSVINQLEQMVNEEALSKPQKTLSLPVENKSTDIQDGVSKEAITFSSLLKSGDNTPLSPPPASPEQVLNTMVDFINKKISASPTEATFSQGTKKIALTELQFNPQDLTSLKVDSYTAKLKVYPPDLGQVIAEIQINNGQTELTIRTENPQVKHFIEQHLVHLRESFEQSNINLGQVSIQDNTPKDNSSRQQAFYSSSTEVIREPENAHKDPYLRDKKNTEQTIDTYA